MDVEHVMRQAEIVHRDHRDGSEGFVDLEQVNILDRPAGLCTVSDVW